MARSLASTGARILILERGERLPREPQNTDAEAVFAHAGFEVTPAPMGYFSAKEGLMAWLPSAAMLANSAQLWREAIGQQAYRWHRYRTSLNTDITPHPPTSQPVSRP